MKNIVMVLLVAFLAVTVMDSCKSQKNVTSKIPDVKLDSLTLETCKKIQAGMTENQVKDILGLAYSEVVVTSSGQHLSFRGEVKTEPDWTDVSKTYFKNPNSTDSADITGIVVGFRYGKVLGTILMGAWEGK